MAPGTGDAQRIEQILGRWDQLTSILETKGVDPARAAAALDELERLRDDLRGIGRATAADDPAGANEIGRWIDAMGQQVAELRPRFPKAAPSPIGPSTADGPPSPDPIAAGPLVVGPFPAPEGAGGELGRLSEEYQAAQEELARMALTDDGRGDDPFARAVEWDGRFHAVQQRLAELERSIASAAAGAATAEEQAALDEAARVLAEIREARVADATLREEVAKAEALFEDYAQVCRSIDKNGGSPAGPYGLMYAGRYSAFLALQRAQDELTALEWDVHRLLARHLELVTQATEARLRRGLARLREEHGLELRLHDPRLDEEALRGLLGDEGYERHLERSRRRAAGAHRWRTEQGVDLGGEERERDRRVGAAPGRAGRGRRATVGAVAAVVVLGLVAGGVVLLGGGDGDDEVAGPVPTTRAAGTAGGPEPSGAGGTPPTTAATAPPFAPSDLAVSGLVLDSAQRWQGRQRLSASEPVAPLPVVALWPAGASGGDLPMLLMFQGLPPDAVGEAWAHAGADQLGFAFRTGAEYFTWSVDTFVAPSDACAADGVTVAGGRFPGAPPTLTDWGVSAYWPAEGDPAGPFLAASTVVTAEPRTISLVAGVEPEGAVASHTSVIGAVLGTADGAPLARCLDRLSRGDGGSPPPIVEIAPGLVDGGGPDA